jgi:hypothetical protein
LDVITEGLRTIEGWIGLVPGALIAIVLLAGPTALWLLYRFVVQPRTSRYRAADGTGAMWVCAACRSVNELRMARCYSCDRTPDEAQLHVIDPGAALPLPMVLPSAGAAPRIPVGPGPTDLTSLPGLAGVRGVTAQTRPEGAADRPATPLDDLLTAPTRPSVAVGPGRPRPVRPRRAVVAGGRSGVDPDDAPAA